MPKSGSPCFQQPPLKGPLPPKGAIMSGPWPDPVELDIRPLIKVGHPPFQKIMETVGALPPGAGLRLIAPFEPTPLYPLMMDKGFDHHTKQMPDGSWQIEFTRTVPS